MTLPTFNYAQWLIQYPEFGSVTAQQAQDYFNRASFVVPWDRIPDPLQQVITLNLATAHFAFLFAPLNGQAPRASSVVGRINSASEGSVSAQFSYTDPSTDSQAFWNQSEYGAALWVMTLPYRTAFYVPPLLRNPFGGRFNGGNGRGFF